MRALNLLQDDFHQLRQAQNAAAQSRSADEAVAFLNGRAPILKALLNNIELILKAERLKIPGFGGVGTGGQTGEMLCATYLDHIERLLSLAFPVREEIITQIRGLLLNAYPQSQSSSPEAKSDEPLSSQQENASSTDAEERARPSRVLQSLWRPVSSAQGASDTNPNPSGTPAP